MKISHHLQIKIWGFTLLALALFSSKALGGACSAYFNGSGSHPSGASTANLRNNIYRSEPGWYPFGDIPLVGQGSVIAATGVYHFSGTILYDALQPPVYYATDNLGGQYSMYAENNGQNICLRLPLGNVNPIGIASQIPVVPANLDGQGGTFFHLVYNGVSIHSRSGNVFKYLPEFSYKDGPLNYATDSNLLNAVYFGKAPGAVGATLYGPLPINTPLQVAANEEIILVIIMSGAAKFGGNPTYNISLVDSQNNYYPLNVVANDYVFGIPLRAMQELQVLIPVSLKSLGECRIVGTVNGVPFHYFQNQYAPRLRLGI